MDDFSLAVGWEVNQTPADVAHQDALVGDFFDGVLQPACQAGDFGLGFGDFFLAAGMSVAASPAQQRQQGFLAIHEFGSQGLHGGKSLLQPRHQIVGLFICEQPLHHNALYNTAMNAPEDAEVANAPDGDEQHLFQPGELALFLDRKGRAYLQTLTQDRDFHCHLGFIPHGEVIGHPVGGWYTTSRGHVLLGIRPTLGDYVRLMPRGPQVIYAKDLGNIVSMADIFPGATVVEAGLGSGALTTGLLRAVGPTGRLVSYEINPEVVAKARSNVESVITDTSQWQVRIGDIAEGLGDDIVDRVVLDLPEPWRALDAAAEALHTGGILLCFLPTVLQVHELVMAMQDDGRFARIETAETMLRGWNVTRRSVRPAHRMVAHSGFITTAVRCVPPSRQGYALNP